MMNASIVDQLDENIATLLAHADSEPPSSDPALRELLAVAADLRTLPDPDFKACLKADLMEQGASAAARADSRLIARTIVTSTKRASAGSSDEILPTLFGAGYGVYPIHRRSFVASALAHTAALALLVTVGIFAARSENEVPRVSSSVVTDISPYLLPPAPDRAGGGGGGGDRDDLQASQGNPPRFAREQITPPAIVVRNEHPRLTADPTVVGPPSLSFPQNGPIGDPLAGIVGPPSNGTGSGGGIGRGLEGGVGPGRGPGVGPGSGGGIGGDVYRVGGSVSAPRAIYDPEPEYSEEARKAKYQGVVVLQVIIGVDGLPCDIRVARTLGMGLDQKAIDAVRQWRFEPAVKDRRPVATVVNIEVNFRLY
ncbi:MAG: energy transducer TonB [Acidobacteriia bacterium]|nr:energy transducer TonB [Terriglobia bacterium]